MKTDIHQNKRFLFQIYRFGECDSKRWHFERKKLAKLILKLIKRKLNTIKINDSSKNANWNNDERKVVRFDSVPVPVLVFLSSDLIYCVLFDYFLHIYVLVVCCFSQLCHWERIYFMAVFFLQFSNCFQTCRSSHVLTVIACVAKCDEFTKSRYLLFFCCVFFFLEKKKKRHTKQYVVNTHMSSLCLDCGFSTAFHAMRHQIQCMFSVSLMYVDRIYTQTSRNSEHFNNESSENLFEQLSSIALKMEMKSQVISLNA